MKYWSNKKFFEVMEELIPEIGKYVRDPSERLGPTDRQNLMWRLRGVLFALECKSKGHDGPSDSNGVIGCRRCGWVRK